MKKNSILKHSFILMICLFVNFNFLYSQKNLLVDDNNEITKKIENKIKEDILLYYKINYEYKLLNGNFFKQCADTISYSNYIEKIIFEYKEINSSFSGIKLFSIKALNYVLENDKKIKLTENIMSKLGLQNSILVGYSENCIMILSGNINNSLFSNLFNLNVDEADSFLDFLKIKLFVYDIRDLKYEKQNKNWIFFSGTKEIFSKSTKVFFKIKKDFPDLVIHLGHKISGKYKSDEKIILN